MKNIHFSIISLLFLVAMAWSCNSPNSVAPSNAETKAENDFAILVNKWSDAHNTKDVGALSNLYGQSVLYYGTLKERNECVESKLAFFKKKPDFKQRIVGGVKTENISDSEVKCSFMKSVTVNGENTDYPSYLHFRRIGEEWRITVESDLVTDENLAKRAKKKELGQEMGERVDVSGTYDFNGDGKKESCYLLEPKKIDGEDGFMECDGDCNCLVKFSDASIPPIEIEECIGGMPDILGDLDGNGTIEIGIWPYWWTSCWQYYYVFTLVKDEWTYFVTPFTVHCDLMEKLEESGEPIIEAVKGKEGMFRIKYSDFDADDDRGLLTKTEIVKKLI